ncbi:MAG TPA: terminase TerL endonuclease subunit [Phycisphaerae bacterium]|nr:terminase TerL endonuclease subunit [Phycisphaerae bacterium]
MVIARQRQADQRWIRTEQDRRAVADGCWFDESAGLRVVNFCHKFLRHYKGRWAGKRFELLDWQRDAVMQLYGWKRSDGSRRFRTAFIEIAKKNGKTTFGAALALFALIADGEQGAQVYSAANDREQAAMIYRDMAAMGRASPALAKRLTFTDSTKHVAFPHTNSFYKALSADVPTKEGLDMSFLLVDEIHAAPKRDLYDTLRYSGAARRQPLIVIITTAGDSLEGIGYEEREYAGRVLENQVEDWTYFAYICEADPDCDVMDEVQWAKANPSLDITITRESMREAAAQALASPRKLASFKRYRLDIWGERLERWLSAPAWDRGCCEPVEPTELAGVPCWGGLDLSSTLDLTALVWVFPLDGGRFALVPRFWVPGDNIRQRVKDDRVPYDLWAEQGFVEPTGGNVVDYDVIRERIKEDATRFNVRELAFDRWNATQLSTQLASDGLTVVPYGQGYISMSAPSKMLEALVLAGRLVGGNHPVLRWCALNASIETDPAENIKPSKSKSRERIDGLVATVMGLGRAMVNTGETGQSIYETEELLVI